MSKKAMTKHEIYNNLSGFSARDLSDVANFIDFMRRKKKLGAKRVVKLEGILKDHDIDLSALKEFKEKTWKHLEQELDNG